MSWGLESVLPSGGGVVMGTADCVVMGQWGVFVISKRLDLFLLNHNFSTNYPMNLKLRDKQESLAEISLRYLSPPRGIVWHSWKLM